MSRKALGAFLSPWVSDACKLSQCGPEWSLGDSLLHLQGTDKLTCSPNEFVLALSRLPHLILIPLDDTLARQDLDVAAGHRLRGSDAVYAAVALRFGSTLVTLDREQQERIAALIPAYDPSRIFDELG
jgi:hypothetical protein